MSEVRSRSWTQTVRDWIPKWPNPRRNRDSSETGSESEVQINSVPVRYHRPTSAASAPPDVNMDRNNCNNVSMQSEFVDLTEVSNVGISHSTPKVLQKPQMGRSSESDSHVFTSNVNKLIPGSRPEVRPCTSLTKDNVTVQGDRQNHQVMRNFDSSQPPASGQFDRQNHQVVRNFDSRQPPVSGQLDKGLTHKNQVEFAEGPTRGPFGGPSLDYDYTSPTNQPHNYRSKPNADQGYGGDNFVFPSANQGFVGRQYNHRQRDPDKFNGQTVEWSDYLTHFETVANWNGWNDYERATQLIMSLQGEAQKVFSDVAPYIDTQNYGALIAELENRFNPAEREATFRIEFRNRTRKDNESPMQFGYALRRLASKAFPRISLNAQEQWILDQFVNGLGNAEIRKHVQFAHPRNLHEAISLATEYECFETSSNRKFSKPSSGKLCAMEESESKILQNILSTLKKNGEQINSLSDELSQIKQTKQSDTRSNKGQMRDKSQKSKNVECFRCHEKGHYSRECPKNPATTGKCSSGSKPTKNLN